MTYVTCFTMLLVLAFESVAQARRQKSIRLRPHLAIRRGLEGTCADTIPTPQCVECVSIEAGDYRYIPTFVPGRLKSVAYR